MKPQKTRIHYRTCNLCEAMCGIEIRHQGNQILAIAGDKADPFSRGHICPKAVALQDIYHDPDRLKQPVRRTKSGWEKLSWDDAFAEVAKNLTAIQKKYGKDSVAIYQGNPTVHNSGSLLFAPQFFRTLRTRNRFSATSVDQLPHHFAAYFMFGHQLLLPVPDIDRTDFFLILGANPVASNGSMMTAPGYADRLQQLRARGGKLVVVDPRRTETAALADEHYFIQPGTDVLLLLAIIHSLFAENLIQPGRLKDFTEGLASIEKLVADFSPESVEAITGIDAAAIRQLARDFISAKSAVCYGRLGVSTQAFGTVCQWLVNVLNIVTGNLDRPGGAMFTAPAIDVVRQYAKRGQRGHYGRWSSRVRNLTEFGGELPVAALAEEILTEGEGQIKALITSAGNPVLSTPNGSQVERALAQLEFMASIDIYINETTRHADIILPPTCALETDYYDLVFHLLAVRNTAKYSTALFEPEKGAKHDWQIFHELRRRMQSGHRKHTLASRIKQKIFDGMTPEKMLNLGLRLGPYGVLGGTFLFGERLNLRKLKRNVHGVDLGPLKPCLPKRLFTPNKQIQLAPDVLVQDVERVRATFMTAPAATNHKSDLSLIGRRHLRSNNSWMHNSERLVKGKERCTLLMHPDDAAARNIINRQKVEVRSSLGAIELPVEITGDMMPGVVSIPHGWGHHRPGIQLQTARNHAGVSINDLTDDRLVDDLSGNAAFSNVPVRVSLARNDRFHGTQ
ncbi:MAG: molybdopterin oxidoreductase family protein [bacterium]